MLGKQPLARLDQALANGRLDVMHARALQATGALTLEGVIEAFLRPALTAAEGFGGKTFVKLRARLATEPEAFSRRILARAFDESGREYIAALRALMPQLAAEELA